MKPYLAFVFFMMLAASALATPSPNVDSLANAAPGLKEYPQASAILLYDHKTVLLDGDGRSHTERDFAWLILDERAKDQYGDQSVRFDAEQDTVVIDTARTRLPNGTWIQPEHDAFTVTSAPEVQWASAYSQLKQRNVSFPGLDVGAVIHFHYRIEPKPGSKTPKHPHAGGIALFGDYEPVLEKSLTVIAPPAWKIQYQMQNSTVQPEIAPFNGKTAYRWEFRNVDQVIDEPNSVSLGNIVPRLLWTTFQTWDDLDLFVLQQFLEKVDTAATATKGFQTITTAGLTGVPAIMNAALWVQRNIRNVNLSLGTVGYEPNTADRVWENKYGDPRDKAVLLSALLISYGVESIPVLVTNNTADFSEKPVLEQFTHIILAVPQGEDTLWLDPTSEYYAPGDLAYSRTYGKACLLLNGVPLLTKISAGPIDKRSVNTTMQLTLAETGDLSGRIMCDPRGQFAARARMTFKDQKEQERDIYVQRAASRFGQGTKSTSFEASDATDVTAPIAVSMGIESPGYAVKQDDLLLVEVPGNPFDFGQMGFYPGLPQVKYPIELPAQGRSSLTITMSVPKSYALSYVAPPLIIDNRYVHLELQAEPGQESITWRFNSEIKADEVPLADYKVVRDAYETFALPKYRLAIFEQKKS